MHIFLILPRIHQTPQHAAHEVIGDADIVAVGDYGENIRDGSVSDFCKRRGLTVSCEMA